LPGPAKLGQSSGLTEGAPGAFAHPIHGRLLLGAQQRAQFRHVVLIRRQPVDQVLGVKLVRREGDRGVLAVESGSYRLVIR
jgi:hypothetical protein